MELWRKAYNKLLQWKKESKGERVMYYFRQYMIVGGMPQSVLKYHENKNLSEVKFPGEEQERNILFIPRTFQKMGM